MSSVQECNESLVAVSGDSAGEEQSNTPELLRSCQIKVTRTETASDAGRVPSGNSERKSIRAQERENLIELNDRLASYIDIVRSLETENVHLRTVLENHSSVQDSEIQNIKEMYSAELDVVRKNLDEVATERARLEIDLNRYKSRAQEAERSLQDRDGEIRDLKSRLAKLEEMVAQLRSQNAAIASEMERNGQDLKKTNARNAELMAKLEKVRKQLESETLSRVDAENRSITLTEELEFLRDVSEKEINKVKQAAAEVANLSTRVENAGADERAMNDNLMRQQIQEIRQETEEKIEQMRIEIDSNYRKRLEDLEQRLSHSLGVAQSQKSDLDHCRRRICELCTDRDHLNARLTSRELALNEAEDRSVRDREQFDRQVTCLEESLLRSQKQYQSLNDDYNELMDLKVTLDQEIETYRRLVESEEERLNITGRKRRRTTESVEEVVGNDGDVRGGTRQPSVRFSTSSQHAGPVAIMDTENGDSDVVVLRNTSVRPVSIGGWVLSRRCSDGDGAVASVVEHKFPRNTVIQPNEEIRVYSADVQGVVHNPSEGSYVMTRGKRWQTTGARVATRLMNLANEEVASKGSMVVQEEGSTEQLRSAKVTRRSSRMRSESSEIRSNEGGQSTSVKSRLFGLFAFM